jgi:hypothetical protein
MNVATSTETQNALTGLIDVFEDAFVRQLALPTPVRFEPLLVIDVRFGKFRAFVLSLNRSNQLYGMPRNISVEVSQGSSQPYADTPLCAYRKENRKESRKETEPRWKVCSEQRLNEVNSQEGFIVADHIFEYALAGSDATSQFERLWFAFLGPLSQTDSGQDYQQIIFVVDDLAVAELIQNVMPKLSSKLDKGDDKWASAYTITLPPSTDLSGYAFLTQRDDLQQQAWYALLLNQHDARQIFYDGYSFHPAAMTPLRCTPCRQIPQFPCPATLLPGLKADLSRQIFLSRCTDSESGNEKTIWTTDARTAGHGALRLPLLQLQRYLQRCHRRYFRPPPQWPEVRWVVL